MPFELVVEPREMLAELWLWQSANTRGCAAAELIDPIGATFTRAFWYIWLQVSSHRDAM